MKRREERLRKLKKDRSIIVEGVDVVFNCIIHFLCGYNSNTELEALVL